MRDFLLALGLVGLFLLVSLWAVGGLQSTVPVWIEDWMQRGKAPAFWVDPSMILGARG